MAARRSDSVERTAASQSAAMDVARVPGTQLLVDVEHKLHAAKRSKDEKDIVLIPAPSSDPDDPLRWPRRRKLLATLCYSLYTLANGLAGSNLYSILVPFSKIQAVPVAALNAGTGYLFLLAGWSLLFWQPFALQYGKRLTYLVSLLGLVGISAGSPFIKTSGQWYARSILTGFFASPIEALPEVSVADLWFAHQRGTFMALYAGTLVGSNFLSPIIFGFVNDGQGYRWVFFWPAIFCAIAAVVIFFFGEETNYDRNVTVPLSEAAGGTGHNGAGEASLTAKSTEHFNSTEEESAAAGPKKTYLQKLSLKDKPRPFMMFYRLKLQLRFLAWPIPVYAGFAYGSTLIWFNVLNATSSLVLSAPPYSFSPSIVGLCYVAPLLGTALGFLVTGRLSDALVLRLARRNAGVMEPEQRLWIFALSTLLIPTGLILWGVGASRGVQWFGLLFAMAIFGFVNTCGASLGVTYLVDCYREMSGEALTALIIVRNTMSFAISYGITPWLQNLGLQNAFISAAFIGMAASLSFLIMVKWGKRLRQAKGDKYWALVEESKRKGLVH